MGVVTSIGTKIETGLVTTCAITVTQAVPIGDSVLVAAGCSRTGVTATCADSRGNTYTPDKNQTGTGSSSFSILSAPVTVALQIGDTITVTFSSANTSSNANMAIAGTHAGLLTIDKTAGALGSSTNWSSGATVTTTQTNEVCFGGSFNNASADGTSTGTGGYTNVAAINDSAVGALGFNLTAVYLTVAATGAQTATGTWSATGASQDTKSAVATYKLPVTSSAPSLVPLRIPNPHVGPQALRHQFHRSVTQTPLAVTPTVFNDSGSGTITLSGTGTESQSHTASGAGTLTLSGTFTQSQTHTGSGAGTITLSGSGTETQTHTASGAGTLTFSGARTESQTHTATGAGTVTVSGTGSESFIPPGATTAVEIDWTTFFIVTHF